MTINGHPYSREEILEALRKKGYIIVPYRTYYEKHIHGSFFHKEWYDSYCALRPGEEPCDRNEYHNVAIKEFEKRFAGKPPLA